MTLFTHLCRSNAMVRMLAGLAIVGLFTLPVQVNAAGGTGNTIANYNGGFSAQQQANLMQIARDTWKFYTPGVGVDATTGLPLDNVGPGTVRGTYTSPTNIGVYFWSVVAAMDLGLISRPEARARLETTLNTVQRLQKFDGFLYSWYDTSTGAVISGSSHLSCSDPAAPRNPCKFISSVDNGWFASGLIVVRQALPELKKPATDLLDAMQWMIFYDNGDLNTNLTAGQLHGGYFTDTGTQGVFDNGMLNTDYRIAYYIGMGMHQLPGAVWWRTWRTLPTTNPPPPPVTYNYVSSNFDWQGQYPPKGYYTNYTDPLSGQPFTVFEGHYTYNGIDFIPSWGGSMFEGLMANLVVPETSWGPRSFGLNDLRYAEMQVAWAMQGLGYPVWGLSPSSTPDDTGGYDAFGAVGPPYPNAIASNANCCPYDQYAVTPHASFLALDVIPEAAYDNIQRLRQLYPGLYGLYGFYDAVNPTTKSIGHRDLDLDQSMIMAGLDNALENRQMQRYFARDPISQVAQTYLSLETMSIH